MTGGEADRPIEGLVDRTRLFSASFLAEHERQSICEEMGRADRQPATAFKGAQYSVRPDFRRTNRCRVSAAVEETVRSRLIEWRARLAAHFDVALDVCQQPQFLSYSVGDFFRPHQDCGVASTDPEPIKRRRISIVVLLNPGEYEGGVLTLHEIGVRGSGLGIRGRAGGLVAFHSVVVHEVTPITKGERYSIACWYEGADR